MYRKAAQTLLLVLLLSGVAVAQAPPHPVMLTPITYSDITTVVLAVDLTYEAYITTRPGETIANEGSIADGFIQFDLNVFPTTAAIGETLAVHIFGAGSNYPHPEDREFLGIVIPGGIRWITETGPGGEFFLPIELVSFSAQPGPNRVALTWTTASELDNAGFNVLRQTERQGPYTIINDEMIPGAGTSTEEHVYAYTDEKPTHSLYFYTLESISTSGERECFGPTEVRTVPAELRLNAASPNPKDKSSEISFGLPSRGSVSLVIHDISGREVMTLLDEEMDAGHHARIWNGTDSKGRQVSNGAYFYRITAKDFSQTRKLLVIR